MNKYGFYIDENIAKTAPTEYSDEDIEFTKAVNTSRTVAALERQVKLYEKEIESVKRTTRITKWSAIASAIIGVLSILATIVCTCIEKGV